MKYSFKRILFFFFLVTLCNGISNYCFSQWIKIHTNTGNQAYDLAFVNDSVGVFGTYLSMTPASKQLGMVRTSDFGLSWTNIPIYTQGNAPVLGRLGGDTITMLSGDSWYPGCFMISANGGQTYQTSSLGVSARQYHLEHINYGIYSFSGAFLHRKYSNVMSSVGTFTTSGIKDLWYNSSKDFFVISGNKLYATNDTGATWNIVASPTVAMNKMAFSSYSVGYIACTGGTVMKSMDAGMTWTVINTGVIQNFNSLSFKNDNLGYVVGTNGTVLKTGNGGISWIQEVFPGTQNLSIIKVLNKKAYILSGNELFRRDVDTCSLPPSASLTASSYTTCISAAGNPTISLNGNPPGGTYSGANIVGNILYAPTSVSSNSLNVYYTYKDLSGCATTTFVTLQITTPTPASLAISAQTICVNGGTIALNGTPPGGTYAGPNVSGPIFTAPSSTTNPNNFISYTYVDGQGCKSSWATNIAVFACVGINELNLNSSEVSIFPNPTTGIINLDLNSNNENLRISLFNYLGDELLTKTLTQNESSINLTTYQAGIYFIKVYFKDNYTRTLKVVKE